MRGLFRGVCSPDLPANIVKTDSTAFRVLAIAILGLSVFAVWKFWFARRDVVRLSSRAENSVSRIVLAEEPIYLQRDPRWADDKIGGSGEPLRRVGCTICCLSMALAQHGISLDPSELNRRLKAVGGYTSRGWVRWESVGEITGAKVRVDIQTNPSHRELQDALKAGNPVLVKVLLSSAVQHWVLLVGCDQREYLMKDPLGDGKSLKLLSSLHSDILAVRIVVQGRFR